MDFLLDPEILTLEKFYRIWCKIDGSQVAPHQIKMCNFIQENLYSRETIQLGFRSGGKSYIDDVTGSWYAITQPNASVLIISSTPVVAERNFELVKKILNLHPCAAPLRAYMKGMFTDKTMFESKTGAVS